MSLSVFLAKLEVPFFLEEMWENSHSKWSKLVEDVRQESSIVYLKVQACFISQPHNLSENKPDIFDEERINEGIYNFGVPIPRMLVQYDLILHEEMRDIVIEVNFLWNCVYSDCLPATVYGEAEILWWRVQGWVTYVWLDLSFVKGLWQEWLNTLNICCCRPSYADFFEEERIFVVDVKAVLESWVFMSRDLYEILY